MFIQASALGTVGQKQEKSGMLTEFNLQHGQTNDWLQPAEKGTLYQCLKGLWRIHKRTHCNSSSDKETLTGHKDYQGG